MSTNQLNDDYGAAERAVAEVLQAVHADMASVHRSPYVELYLPWAEQVLDALGPHFHRCHLCGVSEGHYQGIDWEWREGDPIPAPYCGNCGKSWPCPQAAVSGASGGVS